MTNPYTLTIADVLTLRASIRWRTNVTLPDSLPRIVYSASDDAYVLHHNGRIQAQHEDIGVLAALLRGERAEPGFIARVVQSHEPPDAATLAPDARRAQQARDNAEAAKRRLYASTEAADAKRRVSLLDASRLTLDDLIGDL